jgi:hypothetical protein
MVSIDRRGRPQLFALVLLCTAWTTVSIQGAEFLPHHLTDDSRPQPPFAHEVEVTVRPVTATQALDEAMAVTLTMKNLCSGNLILPHGWGNSYLCDLWIEVDHGFAAQHGIHVREYGAISIAAPIHHLSSDQTTHAVIDLRSYLSFARPVRPPVPVTWRLVLRPGEEKHGHFFLRIHVPEDSLDEVMEQHRRDQDKDLPGLIELSELLIPTRE